MWSKYKNWGIIIVSILTIVVSILTIIVGLLLIVKGFIPIGIAVVSIGIAFCSIYLSVKSGERLTTIANAIFMEIVDIFEDKRIQLLQHPDWLGLKGTIWKCKTYVDRAYDLHKSTKIDEPNRHTLFEWFNKLIYETGINFNEGYLSYELIGYKGKEGEKGQKLQEKDIDNILKMVNKFQSFGLSKDDLIKLDTIEKTVRQLKNLK